MMRVALLGKSGAGKSEVSTYLGSAHSFQVVRTGAICRQIASLLFGNEAKSTTQLLDDALTPLEEALFLKASLRTADLSRPTVIDSLRFMEDVRHARALGFTLLRIQAGDGIRDMRLRERGQIFDIKQDGKHRSEVELDTLPADYEIINMGDITALHKAIDAFLRSSNAKERLSTLL